MTFKNFDFLACKSYKALEEEMKVFEATEILSMEDAYTLSTELPKVSPQTFFEELLDYWSEDQTPVIRNKEDRYVMAQIHAITLSKFQKYIMAEELVYKLCKYWDTVEHHEAYAFCKNFISSGQLAMEYKELHKRDAGRVALQICIAHKRPIDFARISFIDLDLQTIRRTMEAACCKETFSQEVDHGRTFYTETLVSYLEGLRVKLRRRTLI